MKKVTVEKYEAVDGRLFDSSLEAKEYEDNSIAYGVGRTDAAVSRELAKMYAIHQMSRDFPTNWDKRAASKRGYGLCEVEELLDFIYGYTRGGGTPVKVEDMVKEIKA